jgi:hypothetical protein
MEEENLSQKMKDLSTDITNPKDSLFNETKIKIETIPNYLTKGNKSFKHMIYQILSTMKIATTTKNMDDLRQIAILNYKIMIIQIYQFLWTAYIKSGMGQLIDQSKEKVSIIYPTNLSIWPKDIKTMIQAIKMDKKANVEQEHYLEFVNSHLSELDNHLKKYQIELNTKVNHFQGYKSTIQIDIEKYLEPHLHSFRMEIEHKLELIHYDYHIQALKIEYFRHKSNDFQVK